MDPTRPPTEIESKGHGPDLCVRYSDEGRNDDDDDRKCSMAHRSRCTGRCRLEGVQLGARSFL